MIVKSLNSIIRKRLLKNYYFYYSVAFEHCFSYLSVNLYIGINNNFKLVSLSNLRKLIKLFTLQRTN